MQFNDVLKLAEHVSRQNKVNLKYTEIGNLERVPLKTL